MKTKYIPNCIFRQKTQGNASFRALLRARARGSLTVEAALITPFIFLVMVSLMQLFGAAVFQSKLQRAIENVGRRLSYYYYAIEEIEGDEERSLIADAVGAGLVLVASETVVKGLVLEELRNDGTTDNLIKGGKNAISFAFTYFDREHETLHMTARYEVKIPFLELLGLNITVPVVQGTAHRIWTGRELPEGDDEEMVYVTENGSVYHTHLSCGSLSLQVKEISRLALDSARNADGEIYRACEYCTHGQAEHLYVSVYGNRYHYDRNCSGLKRTIKTIPISQVGDRTLCKRCAKRSGQ